MLNTNASSFEMGELDSEAPNPKRVFKMAPRSAHRNGRIRFAVSCSSNMNRSMEAHDQLYRHGYNVKSYGSGTAVKLPGPSPDRPNVYDFDTATYADIRKDLISKNRQLYVSNGLLPMLERNAKIKERPQKFQKCSEEFDVILALEERVYDQIVDYFHQRSSISGRLVHLINVDIKDTHEEALIGANFVRQLCEKIESLPDLDDNLDDLLSTLDADNPERNLLHVVHFY